MAARPSASSSSPGVAAADAAAAAAGEPCSCASVAAVDVPAFAAAAAHSSVSSVREGVMRLFGVVVAAVAAVVVRGVDSDASGTFAS